MIPNDPLPATDHQSPVTSGPFWTYFDLLLFALLVCSSLAFAFLLALLLSATKIALALKLVLPQVVIYALAFGSLKVLLLIRYQQPFWRSLAWKPLPFLATTASLFAGPVLAVAVGLVGTALHTPELPLPFQLITRDAGTVILLGILVVVLGPLCEELAFRGFLMPLLIRSLGTAGGIVITGIIFGCSHGYEYEWSWRHMILISGAGCAFGWAKYKTGSTASAAFMHSTFNLMQFAFFLIQSRPL